MMRKALRAQEGVIVHEVPRQRDQGVQTERADCEKAQTDTAAPEVLEPLFLIDQGVQTSRVCKWFAEDRFTLEDRRRMERRYGTRKTKSVGTQIAVPLPSRRNTSMFSRRGCWSCFVEIYYFFRYCPHPRRRNKFCSGCRARGVTVFECPRCGPIQFG
ncbi:uncharacterized protein LOC112460479 [Temnothorax curvispinosus]|uniref:Uncharacterized protein LOC112460479 n=1 Tax=Temnothorax curvispinosus TaxID=300111 RepID=A0A6J1QIB9_9HYME|nr:uncharacterized protein LOC112460479 [Temnothorax curvispinosus]XP_024880931.1 uncharacterized protein LOC112460479 [Temnothorax curvispinosus]